MRDRILESLKVGKQAPKYKHTIICDKSLDRRSMFSMMLSAPNVHDIAETPPSLELNAQDIANLASELHSNHAIYSPFFRRKEQRQWARDYLHGLLLNIPSKSITLLY